MSGLAQKNGSVMSHVRIAPTQAMLNATRVAAGEANLVLGCDVLTTTAEDLARKDGRWRDKSCDQLRRW